MTARKNFKRLVRARAARTGESYTAALRHFLPTVEETTVTDHHPFRLAVGQLPVHGDPTDAAALRDAGTRIRDLMRRAHRTGARLLHLPEGATCFPDKLVVSSTPGAPGPADWSTTAWDVLHAELEQTAALAGELSLWTVLGSTHRLTPPLRPHNSLYVLSAAGAVHTRYDERFMSHTKTTFMYSPGREPVTFEVDGRRFGCALGIECHFPEVFGEYERLDVDCVLFSSTGDGAGNAATFALECRGHAATNGFWVSFAVPPQAEASASSGVVAPGGRWLGQCSPGTDPGTDLATDLVTVELDEGAPDVEVAVTKARPWRRVARQASTADPVDDPRSRERAAF
ncbi:carbon-nitrogen hydrolase family protein [Kineococcus sp. R86509]|uniref:carbon-nitrogen hydrolase family protein n=1 Tax=Kineococcus sp. R86509 TaxID=3093851 RepID=UPI0036D371D2